MTPAGGDATVPRMVARRRTREARLLFAALYALAAVVLGFAHRMPVSAAEDLSAYLLPGQTVVDLCRDGDAAPSDPAHHAGRALCDACLLTAAPGLPPVSAALPTPPAGDAVRAGMILALRTDAREPRRFEPRGPPTA